MLNDLAKLSFGRDARSHATAAHAMRDTSAPRGSLHSSARPLAMIEELAHRLAFHLKIATEGERQFKSNGRQSVSFSTKYERKVYSLLISHRHIQIEPFPRIQLLYF